MTDTIDFSPLQNDRFAIQHFAARIGHDTPDHFICPTGLRPWSRFFFLQSGTVDFWCRGGRKLSVSEGDILYLPHNVAYTSAWTDKQNGWYYSVEFILGRNDSEPLVFSDDLTVVCRSADSAYLSRIQEMVKVWNEGAVGYWMKSCELFLAFLQMMVEKHKRSSLYSQCDQIREGLIFLDNNYTRDVTTEQLAALCHMSESNFRKLFRKFTGTSPITYRNMLRMRRARELIETGLYSVKEAATIVNVSDPYYFNKMFRQVFDTPPSLFLPEKNNN